MRRFFDGARLNVGSISKEIVMASETNGGIHAVKAARNQSLWREINERVRTVAETSGNMEFLCECADLECTQTIKLSVGEYEFIRSSPVRFPVALGHVFAEVEDVVEENERYAIVQKKGVAAEVVAKLDPRLRS
jgi:hypothetical protein